MLPREGLSSPLTASENQGDRPLPDQLPRGPVLESTLCSALCCLHSLYVLWSPLWSLFFWRSTQKRTFLLQARNAKVKSLNSLVTHRQVSHHVFALKTKKVSCWGFIGQRLHRGSAFSPARMRVSVFSGPPPPHYHGKKEQRRECASSERKFIDWTGAATQTGFQKALWS